MLLIFRFITGKIEKNSFIDRYNVKKNICEHNYDRL